MNFDIQVFCIQVAYGNLRTLVGRKCLITVISKRYCKLKTGEVGLWEGNINAKNGRSCFSIQNSSSSTSAFSLEM